MSQHRCAVCISAGPSRRVVYASLRLQDGVSSFQRRRYNDDSSRSSSTATAESRPLPTTPPLLTRIRSIWNPSVLKPHLIDQSWRGPDPPLKKPAQSWADIAPRVNLPPPLTVPTISNRAKRRAMKKDGKAPEKLRTTYQPLTRVLETVRQRGQQEEDEGAVMKKYIMETLRGKILELRPLPTRVPQPRTNADEILSSEDLATTQSPRAEDNKVATETATTQELAAKQEVAQMSIEADDDIGTKEGTPNPVDPGLAAVDNLDKFKATLITPFWSQVEKYHPTDGSIVNGDPPTSSALARLIGIRVWYRYKIFSATITGGRAGKRRNAAYNTAQAKALDSYRLSTPSARIQEIILEEMIRMGCADMRAVSLVSPQTISDDQVLSPTAWLNLLGRNRGSDSTHKIATNKLDTLYQVLRLQLTVLRQLRKVGKVNSSKPSPLPKTLVSPDTVPIANLQTPPSIDMETAGTTVIPSCEATTSDMLVEQLPENDGPTTPMSQKEEVHDSWGLRQGRIEMASPPSPSVDPVQQIEDVNILLSPLDDFIPSTATASSDVQAVRTPDTREPTDVDIIVSGEVSATQAIVQGVPPPRMVKVASLMHGLDRVLFNPTVHFLRDPHSNVYTFDPRLESIPTAAEFAFDRLPPYITASRDEDLLNIAEKRGLTFYGSTSTLTVALSQIYFLISGDRGVDASSLSQTFEKELSPSSVSTTFTAGARLPAALVIRAMPNGRYAIDNDKTWDTDENILSDIGRILEKVITTKPTDLRKYLRRTPASAISDDERNAREAYRYCKGQSLLMRSQLDCRDSRLPGSGTFDIKTRAAMPIRQDRANYEENSAYDINKVAGVMESFEKEYYDMIRSAFLKYSLQVRIGGMDGIFVAYHNTKRIFGFQYIPLSEMDKRLHGTSQMGARAFQLSVFLLEKILEEVIKVFPGKTCRLIIEKGRSNITAFAEPESPLNPAELQQLVGARQGEEDIGEKPVVAFKLEVQSKLNGTVIDGPVAFETVPGGPENVEWTIDYTITRSGLDPTAIAKARKGMELARKRHVAMSTLSLPSDKTAADMEKARKKRMEALVSQAEGLAKASDSDSGAKGPTVQSALPEGVLPPHANDYTAVQPILWRRASGYTLGIRRLAKESGARYTQRMKGVKGKKPVVWQAGRVSMRRRL